MVADILVLQKGAQSKEKFINLEPIETWDHTGVMRVNEYFARNPKMILGRASNTGKMYGRIGSATILPFDDLPLAELLTVPELQVQHIKPPETDMLGVIESLR